METVLLTAQINTENDRYVVRLDDLGLVGEGETLEAAQEELI